jgi:AcrR family transcriptional regulator
MSRQRERKLRIAEAALRLFEERGLEGTTVEAIAAEAGVSPRTFFRYFETKESAAFPDHADRVAELGALLDARLPSPRPLEDLVEVSRRSVTAYFDEPKVYARRYRLLRSDATLHNLERVFDRAYEDRLADFLGACGADVMTARACAASVVAVVNEALDVWARARGDAPAAGRAGLDAGLKVVVEAFSGLVGPGRDEGQRRNVAVIIPVGDPLRDEILAAVERGVSVTVDDSRVDPLTPQTIHSEPGAASPPQGTTDIGGRE